MIKLSVRDVKLSVDEDCLYLSMISLGDETHSWGADDEEASDEYWHFVGRYE